MRDLTTHSHCLYLLHTERRTELEGTENDYAAGLSPLRIPVVAEENRTPPALPELPFGLLGCPETEGSAGREGGGVR